MKRRLAILAMVSLSACGVDKSEGMKANVTTEPKITAEEAERHWQSVLAAMSPEARAEFEAIQAKERARPKIKNLTPDLLRTFPDEYLDDSLIEHIQARLRKSDFEKSALLALPRGLQVFYISYVVESEVMNGGLNQFFWNSSSQYAELVSPALRDLEAPAAAALFEQALSVATQDIPRISALRKQRTLEAFSNSYKNNPLNALDEPFSKMALGFSALRLQYARRHADRFF
jgi:hypothetical protein